MVASFKEVFTNVAWPAAAGNVFWAMCNISLARPTVGQGDEVPLSVRLIVLVCFCFYLTVGWLRIRVQAGIVRFRYWFFEFLHVSAIVITANATHIRDDLIWICLLAFFVTTIAGHIFNAWHVPNNEGKFIKKEGEKFQLITVNAIGVLMLILGDCLLPIGDWWLAIAPAAVFIGWTIIRWKGATGQVGLCEIEGVLEARLKKQEELGT